MSDAWLLRDLIDRRPELNAVALRPGQSVHVHALERLLSLVEELSRFRTWREELEEQESEELSDRQAPTLDEVICAARNLLGIECTGYGAKS